MAKGIFKQAKVNMKYRSLHIDSKVSRHLLVKEIVGFAGKSDHAKTIEDAFEVIRTARPDVIICEVYESSLDVRLLLDSELVEGIPFIFLSAYERKEEKREGLLKDEHLYLTYPVDLDEFERAIERQVNPVSLKVASSDI